MVVKVRWRKSTILINPAIRPTLCAIMRTTQLAFSHQRRRADIVNRRLGFQKGNNRTLVINVSQITDSFAIYSWNSPTFSSPSRNSYRARLGHVNVSLSSKERKIRELQLDVTLRRYWPWRRSVLDRAHLNEGNERTRRNALDYRNIKFLSRLMLVMYACVHVTLCEFNI